jgi:hypothetical protein
MQVVCAIQEDGASLNQEKIRDSIGLVQQCFFGVRVALLDKPAVAPDGSITIKARSPRPLVRKLRIGKGLAFRPQSLRMDDDQ